MADARTRSRTFTALFGAARSRSQIAYGALHRAAASRPPEDIEPLSRAIYQLRKRHRRASTYLGALVAAAGARPRR